MRYRPMFAWFTAVSLMPALGVANSHHGGGGSHPAHMGGGGFGPKTHQYSLAPAAVGGGWSWYGFPYYGVVGPNGPLYIPQPLPMLSPILQPIIVDRGMVGGPMPPAQGMAEPAPRKLKKADPARMGQLVTIGDRLFRVGNIKRASERYEQAVKADPDAASPRVRLAQVALSRGQYREAAQHFRAAIAAEPNFLANASDIQAIYAEPGDFTRQIGRLESHVLVDPGDRHAWLVLGAQLYLSGQTRRASDIFVRLTDRKPDPTLAAFLDASNTPEKPAD